jgi:trk system potassium uptake protein TrkA
MRQFAVIGLGRFGMSVAKTLSEKGAQVLALDMDEQLVQEASEFVTHAVKVDATDEKALKAVGINKVNVAVVSIGVDLEASTLATLALKEIGVQEIVAKAITENQGKVLRKVGATRIVFPEMDMGMRVANSLLSPKIIDHINLSDECGVFELIPPKGFIGKSLRQIDVRAKYGLNVIAIRKGKDKLDVAPLADDKIEKGDVLVIIGKNENIEKLKKEAG